MRPPTGPSCGVLIGPGAPVTGIVTATLWFAYRIGVLLALGKKNVTASEVYVGGVHDRPLSGWLAGRLKDAGLA